MAEDAPPLVMELSTGGTVEPMQAFETTAEGKVALGVFIQDQTTPALFVKANRVLAQDTVATETVVDSYTVILDDATGFTAGDLLILTSEPGDRYYQGRILLVSTNTLTMDTQLDYAFEVGQAAAATSTAMDVDGSSTPVIFGLRAAEPPAGLNITVDITRIILSCQTLTPVDLSKFGDLAALTRGLAVRRVDGVTQNIINWKTNSDLAGSMYDWQPFAATNPQQGQDGFVSRLTFAGANKVGVAIRLAPNEELQFIVQDNLTGLTEFEIMIEGHVVQ